MASGSNSRECDRLLGRALVLPLLLRSLAGAPGGCGNRMAAGRRFCASTPNAEEPKLSMLFAYSRAARLRESLRATQRAEAAGKAE